MPYVMPQQIKEKTGAALPVRQCRTPVCGSLFVGTDRRCCFIKYAVYKLVAVFSAEGFRQLDRFVDGHFIRHIITFRQLKQRDTQHCFFHWPSSSSRRDRYGFIRPSRYALLVATPDSSSRKYRTSTSFTSCSDRNWYSTSAMSFWDNCQSKVPGRHIHGRGDEQQVSRNSPYKKIRP